MESLAKSRRFSFHAAVVVRSLVPCALLIVASCMRPGITGYAQDRFEVGTSNGVVLAIVEGSAKGFSNTQLTRLIRGGVAEAYVIRCNEQADLPAARKQMIWQVINDGRKPTAMISVHVVQDGRTVGFAYKNIAAPGSNPNAVFMYDVMQLARRVLPAAEPHGLSRAECS